MDRQLLKQGMVKFLSGLCLTGLLVFLPAGTLGYWNGWLLMGILFAPMLTAGFVMLRFSPDLLRKRLSFDEREPAQRRVIAWSGLMFVASFVVAGLNFRLRWCPMPAWSAWAAAVAFLLAYALYAEVLRENAYLSRTVEVQANQRVIDTGLYGVVRHPMYAATLVLFLAMPLVQGSPLSFLIMLAYIPIIKRRIENEEAVLSAGLPGYADYAQRVRYRLIPGVW